MNGLVLLALIGLSAALASADLTSVKGATKTAQLPVAVAPPMVPVQQLMGQKQTTAYQQRVDTGSIRVMRSIQPAKVVAPQVATATAAVAVTRNPAVYVAQPYRVRPVVQATRVVAAIPARVTAATTTTYHHQRWIPSIGVFRQVAIDCRLAPWSTRCRKPTTLISTPTTSVEVVKETADSVAQVSKEKEVVVSKPVEETI